jgi:hypothetical protein
MAIPLAFPLVNFLVAFDNMITTLQVVNMYLEDGPDLEALVARAQGR